VTAPFDLVTFEPGNEEHQAFAYDTFRKSTDVWPWSEMPRQRLMERLKRELATPGTDTRIATPLGMPGSFLGWYSVRPSLDIARSFEPVPLIYAFTRYSARRQGVAVAALERMAGDRRMTVFAVLFWTPACARLAAAGKRLFFDTREAFDDER
jgi:hypothetical protein